MTIKEQIEELKTKRSAINKKIHSLQQKISKDATVELATYLNEVIGIIKNEIALFLLYFNIPQTYIAYATNKNVQTISRYKVVGRTPQKQTMDIIFSLSINDILKEISEEVLEKFNKMKALHYEK